MSGMDQRNGVYGTGMTAPCGASHAWSKWSYKVSSRLSGSQTCHVGRSRFWRLQKQTFEHEMVLHFLRACHGRAGGRRLVFKNPLRASLCLLALSRDSAARLDVTPVAIYMVPARVRQAGEVCIHFADTRFK